MKCSRYDSLSCGDRGGFDIGSWSDCRSRRRRWCVCGSWSWSSRWRCSWYRRRCHSRNVSRCCTGAGCPRRCGCRHGSRCRGGNLSRCCTRSRSRRRRRCRSLCRCRPRRKRRRRCRYWGLGRSARRGVRRSWDRRVGRRMRCSWRRCVCRRASLNDCHSRNWGGRSYRIRILSSKENPRYNHHHDCDKECKGYIQTATAALRSGRAPRRRWSSRRRTSRSDRPGIEDGVFSRLIRSFRVFAKVIFCLRIDSTRTRLTRSAPPFPFRPSTVAVLTPAVERSVIDPSGRRLSAAGSQTLRASHGLPARYRSPIGDNLSHAHTHVACEFTLCFLTARLGDCQQGLVRLIDLLEAFLSLGISVDVGVVFEGQPAESPSDLLIRGARVNSQNLVEGTHGVWATSSLTPTLPAVGFAPRTPIPNHSQPRLQLPPYSMSHPGQVSDNRPLPRYSARLRRWPTRRPPHP